jgi:hypothetical protein
MLDKLDSLSECIFNLDLRSTSKIISVLSSRSRTVDKPHILQSTEKNEWRILFLFCMQASIQHSLQMLWSQIIFIIYGFWRVLLHSEHLLHSEQLMSEDNKCSECNNTLQKP